MFNDPFAEFNEMARQVLESGVVASSAKVSAALRDALIAEGFTREEAVRIVAGQGFSFKS